MRVLVNALSTTNLSGRHVLLGHLRRLAEWTAGEHEYIVLHHGANADMVGDLRASNVAWHECPLETAAWHRRALWERTNLQKVATLLEADCVFFPSGVTCGSVKLPQVVYAMNPWCLVPGVPHGAGEQVKAALQRFAYRRAVKRAAMMGFISDYLRQAYRKNARREEAASVVAYAGVDDDVFEMAAALEGTEKVRNEILCVSAMAPHKNIETLVDVLWILRREHGVEATLRLVGGWPDDTYAQFIRGRITDQGLDAVVEIAGHVSREELHRAYARAGVFSLLSRCESFGIPAAEAQAFGTPVVCSNVCAIPEICGGGGTYVEPGDAAAAAEELALLLTDDAVRRRRTEAARANVERFRWETVSRPLLKMFDAVRNQTQDDQT